MEYRFTIQGKLPNLNDYINKCRTHPILGANMKRDAQEECEWVIHHEIGGVRIQRPVIIRYTFYEPNRKRDLDNIAGFAHKVIQDALVTQGILHNDGWNAIVGYEDRFDVDSKNPRIEVTICEVEYGT